MQQGPARLVVWLLISICPSCHTNANRAAESTMHYSILSIRNAEVTYFGKHNRYGYLPELAHEGLVDKELAIGEKSGYRFRVDPGPKTYSIASWPITYARTGQESVFIDHSGILHSYWDPPSEKVLGPLKICGPAEGSNGGLSNRSGRQRGQCQ